MNRTVYMKKQIMIFTTIILIISIFCIVGDAQSAIAKVKRPQGVEISVSKNTIQISWKPAKGATGYEVWGATKKSGKYKLIKTVRKCGYKKRNQVAWKKYYYKVRAYKMKSGKKIYGNFSKTKGVTIASSPTPTIKIPAPVTSSPSPTASSPTPVPSGPVSTLSPSPYSIFVVVTQISEENLYVSSETSPYTKCYILKRPSSLSVQEGTRLKILEPQITSESESSESTQILGYKSITILREGGWGQTPYYVKEISNGVLYLANNPSDIVIVRFNMRSNEVLVTHNQNNTIGSIEDIKVGDLLSFYASSPMAVSMPGVILDCTKINILN